MEAVRRGTSVSYYAKRLYRLESDSNIAAICLKGKRNDPLCTICKTLQSICCSNNACTFETNTESSREAVQGPNAAVPSLGIIPRLLVFLSASLLGLPSLPLLDCGPERLAAFEDVVPGVKGRPGFGSGGLISLRPLAL